MVSEMSGNVVIADRLVPVPDGLSCENWRQNVLFHFKHKERVKPLTHLVIHETAGNTAPGCQRTLKRKGLGVHLILERDGHLYNHGDLAIETMAHANQCNKTSIGIEVVNPYAPSLAAVPFEAIPAKWWTWCPDRKDRRYVVPTDAQLKALRILVPWLCSELGIPYEFPTWFLNKRQQRIKHWRLRAKPKPGIVAHGDFSKHADGRWIIEDLILDRQLTERSGENSRGGIEDSSESNA